MYAPIVLFVYKRLTHTRQTVEALQNNALAKESDLIIFSDAPKLRMQADAVREVREYIGTVSGFKSVSIIERDKNWGLANSIIDGVTSVVNKYGRIIVLEDDLIVMPHFLDFMNHALDKYENALQVIQVSGYMFPVKIKIEEDALFLPLTTSWGWATWKRAWQLFDPEAKGYGQVKGDLVLRNRFNLGGAYDYFSMLEAQLTGRVDSWAIRWYLSTFLLGGLTLYPRQSLVINGGLDGSGTHCTNSVGHFPKINYNASHLMIQHFPEQITVNELWHTIRPTISLDWTTLERFKAMLKAIRAVYAK